MKVLFIYLIFSTMKTVIRFKGFFPKKEIRESGTQNGVTIDFSWKPFPGPL